MHVYTSVDIGTDTIKIIVCELTNNRLNLLAASSFKSKGIKKGLITNVDEATLCLQSAFKNIEDMIGIKIDKVIASVPSYLSEEVLSTGEAPIEGDDGIITGIDIDNVLKSSALNNQNGLEVVSVLPIDFSIDNEKGIADPKGKKGKVLRCRSVLVTTPKKNIYSVINVLSSIGIEVVDISLNNIGDIYCVKNSNVDKKIGAVINIGYDYTCVSVYNKGILLKSSIVPYGGRHITNDLSYMYQTDTDTSNYIKERFALAHKIHANVNDTLEVTTKNGEKIKINQLEASEIAMCRVEAILNSAKKELTVLTNSKIEYIIITGGTSNMPQLDYISREIFGDIVNIASIKVLGVRNNKYTSCLGNIIYFISKLKLKGQDYSMISGNDSEKLSSVRKDFLNFSSDSTVGKLFGFFFGE